MTLHIYDDLVQGTDEWLQARCGLATASVVGKLITPTLKVANNEASRTAASTLAAERITGSIDPTWVSADMMRGTQDEPFARDTYAEHYAPVTEVGFITEDKWGFTIGFSPDGLVGEDGLIEIKSRRQHTHLQTVLSQQVPAYNMAQIQCGLLVSGRKWCDYVSFCGGMHLFTKRVEPDPKWFGVIVAAVKGFESDTAQIIRNYEHLTEGLPLTERIPEFTDMVI